jgi:hypothetical protein
VESQPIDKKQEALGRFNDRKRNSMGNTTNENQVYDRLAQSASELQQQSSGGLDPKLAEILMSLKQDMQNLRGG